MKQAQEMQKKLAAAQDKYVGKEFQGVAGGGKVHLTVEVIKIGSYKAKKLDIDLEFMRSEEKEIIEDLIVAAFNDAVKKAEEDMANATSDLAGMMGLPPGLKLPF
ncbi:YbaB/EbfC family nucleoid-associated protein [Wolbachia endosymbiont of Folsomia candida]|uniref:YbaB/EbfC family nucleoid-associated protein n=1 Tax=Wolbachia endosymbiont of Folsomia candida TaxID=169402 RepID=UPI000D78686A|nr:YbaB/EbfC family nucleoid-associated protein [Wolbachia endosymbiont of Folsomia candida]